MKPTTLPPAEYLRECFSYQSYQVSSQPKGEAHA